jgi:hypothetical protein
MTDKTNRPQAASVPEGGVTAHDIGRALDAFEAEARNVAAPDDLGKSWRAESPETKADIRKCMGAALSTHPAISVPEAAPPADTVAPSPTPAECSDLRLKPLK